MTIMNFMTTSYFNRPCSFRPTANFGFGSCSSVFGANPFMGSFVQPSIMNTPFGFSNPYGFGHQMQSLFCSNPFNNMQAFNPYSSQPDDLTSLDFMIDNAFSSMPQIPSYDSAGLYDNDFYNLVNGISNPNFTASSGSMKGWQNRVVGEAQSILGINEADGSYLKVTQGRKEAWCANNVNYVYEKALGTVPWGYADSSGRYKAGVSQIKSWAESEGIYERKETINKVEPGDLIVFKDKNAKGTQRSHIAIVEKVDENGKVHCIDGNVSDKCARMVYDINQQNGVSGFIKMSEYMNSRELIG